MSKTQITPTLEWDEVFDCAVAAWCRSSTSQEMLRMCFQSRMQQNEVSVGWTANELMAFATGIARLAAPTTTPAEQQAAPKAAPQQEAQEPAFVDVSLRTAIAKAVYQQVRVEFDYKLGSWTALDADEQQRIVDSIRGLYTAPQPAPAPLSEREEIAMVDAAMVEMSNIVPPLKRSECARLIRAAIAAQGGKA